MNKSTTLIKKHPILSTLILIVFANGITDLPLQNLLYNFMPYEFALMISIIILQMGSFGFFMYIARKLGFSNTFNMNLSKPIKDLWITIPFFLLIIINTSEQMKLKFITDTPIIFILYFFAFLSTGFFEEILFRGIGFNLINNKFGSNTKGFYFSLFLSNFIFGFSHITHLLKGTVPLINFLNQLIYASIVGILFTALYLRCNTLLIPMLLHGLIDITGCTRYLFIKSPQLYLQSLIQTPVSYKDIFSNLLLFLPFLIWALFLLRKAKFNNNNKSKINI
ncbi:CPBP family intramembrane glutamic endopeptidase [Clostridium oceanicum]|uniref:CAAX prenyl protease 2/Lysostaphin resistance protein A-like domain-containing protein n=1 Tax=Clostridium oceanicum TaxID=1543 RepID=A0ABP3UX54_9CLOT